MDYIEREAICYQLAKQATIDGQPRAIKRAARIVADFPAADVSPVRHGRPYEIKCLNCNSYFTKEDIFGNGEETTPKPITNADRIRAMTDEELADWVWGAECAGRAYGPRGKRAWLDWLKQEATE